jgi:VanZ family protein
MIHDLDALDCCRAHSGIITINAGCPTNSTIPITGRRAAHQASDYFPLSHTGFKYYLLLKLATTRACETMELERFRSPFDWPHAGPQTRLVTAVLPPNRSSKWLVSGIFSKPMPAMPQKLAAIAAWALLCFLAYASVSPIGTRPTLPSSTSLEHIAAFATVGFLFHVGYPRYGMFVWFIVLGSAALFELLQLVTIDRHARLADAFEKMAGGSMGIFLGRAALYFEQTLRRRQI